jgi:hypothetical protein
MRTFVAGNGLIGTRSLEGVSFHAAVSVDDRFPIAHVGHTVFYFFPMAGLEKSLEHSSLDSLMLVSSGYSDNSLVRARRVVTMIEVSVDGDQHTILFVGVL